jgi:aryl sulfotransferase
MSGTLPKIEHRYEHFFWDSGRWEGFEHRSDDVFVCTSYKAGTTWTQMICAQLLLDGKFEGALTVTSPWLDATTHTTEELFERLGAQTHRRFIKTHTPLDGMPYFADATYLFVARDGRDVFMSMENHLHNMNDPAEITGDPNMAMAPYADNTNDLLKDWLTKGSMDFEQDGYPFWSHFRHAQSFWNFRHLPNIHFFHYADMKADLAKEMRRFAQVLNVEVAEADWPRLVDGATFESMKKDANKNAPEVDIGLWKDPNRFFNTGKTGGWRDALNDESLALYDKVTAERMTPDLRAWMEHGAPAGDPKEL